MGFTERDKLIAMAIVSCFETGKPFGDYTAVAVLDDGAGISYGIKQFTHRSKSLYAVLRRFQDLGGDLPAGFDSVMSDLKAGTRIAPIANSTSIKAELRRLGKDPLMHQAQHEIAIEKYLQPAIDACEGDDFQYPLSLAVIYDSKVHGSFDKIRDKTQVVRPGNGSMKPEEYEREWISKYVQNRDRWLESIPRLRKTDYRTDFFLAQIARGNWKLNLPLSVHGVRLTVAMFESFTDVGDSEIDDAISSGPVFTPQQQGEATASSNALPEAQPAPTPAPIQADNLQINETNASVAPPASFVAEDKVIEAPPKDGATSTTTKTAILGVTVPAGVYAIFEAAKSAVRDGYIDMKEVFSSVLELIRNNIKYVSILAGLIVAVVIVKKIFKQATFLLQMYIAARPDLHDVTVKPAEPEPKVGFWRSLW